MLLWAVAMLAGIAAFGLTRDSDALIVTPVSWLALAAGVAALVFHVGHYFRTSKDERRYMPWFKTQRKHAALLAMPAALGLSWLVFQRQIVEAATSAHAYVVGELLPVLTVGAILAAAVYAFSLPSGYKAKFDSVPDRGPRIRKGDILDPRDGRRWIT